MRTFKSIISTFLVLILVLPLLIAVIPLWLFVKTCTMVNKLLKKTHSEWDQIIEFEPEIGWKPKPNLRLTDYYDSSGDRGSITTDREGWPCKFTIEESDVVAFGDSFTFGYGSDFRHTYYSLTRDLSIKPIASPGYNMVQPLILMQRYKEKLKGKSVLWFICLENDLAENIKMTNSLHYTTPFVKKNTNKNEWDIETSHISPMKWIYSENRSYNELQFATLCTPSIFSEKIFSASEFLIQQADEICKSVNARLLIFTIPDKEQLTEKGIRQLTKHLENDKSFNTDYPDQQLAEICHKLDIPFIAGKDHLTEEHYKIRDGHWNRKGNQKVSELISNYYINKINN